MARGPVLLSRIAGEAAAITGRSAFQHDRIDTEEPSCFRRVSSPLLSPEPASVDAGEPNWPTHRAPSSRYHEEKIKIAVNNPFTEFSDTWMRSIGRRKLAHNALMGTGN
jgi:hypothetical protein